MLHVVGTMTYGGTETRLLELVRAVSRKGYVFDFCTLSGASGAYDEELEAHGARVIRCNVRPAATFALRFMALLKFGAYDVVHSHVHLFSGILVWLAELCGVPIRIAHFRTTQDGRADTVARRLYRRAMARMVDRSATRIVGVSEASLEKTLGRNWGADSRCVVVYNGVETTRFRRCYDRAKVRRDLGIPQAARVVLHVGRFEPAKNHAGLLRISQAVARRMEGAMFVLVGDGPLRPAVQAAAASMGLDGGSLKFLGSRSDVPALLAAADLLVLPSLWEGLPGVVLEALAAGVPVVASDIGPVREIQARARGVTLADCGDPEAFADAVCLSLSGESERAELPQDFTAAVSTHRILECYRPK